MISNQTSNQEEKIAQTYKEKYGEVLDISVVYFFKSLIDTVKKSLEESNIEFKIIYSKEYKKKNFFRQLNFIALKYICFVIFIGAIIFAGIDYYNNYKNKNNINDAKETINNILQNLEYDENLENPDIEYIDTVENEETNNNSYNEPSSYYTKYNQLFDELSKVNPDVVGWIKVNNTKIDYPVVQSTDNKYYLKRDFNKKSNSMGWIYMDYRNNIYNLSNNTIIMGHNIKAGLMFGTLRYTTNESWYTNPENQIITFNTKIKNMKWKIFSVYSIPVTNDYLYANFGDLDEFKSFADKLKARSIYDFKVEINKDDHILTLNTCGPTSATRVVVHAVLIKE